MARQRSRRGWCAPRQRGGEGVGEEGLQPGGAAGEGEGAGRQLWKALKGDDEGLRSERFVVEMPA